MGTLCSIIIILAIWVCYTDKLSPSSVGCENDEDNDDDEMMVMIVAQ